MKQVDNDCNDLWVIKDNEGHFIHRNSIRKSGNDTWMYISYKTFTPECRGFTAKTQAEKAFMEINTIKDKANIDMTFHLERHNVEELIQQHKEFNEESMILMEITISRTSLKPASNT